MCAVGPTRRVRNPVSSSPSIGAETYARGRKRSDAARLRDHQSTVIPRVSGAEGGADSISIEHTPKRSRRQLVWLVAYAPPSGGEDTRQLAVVASATARRILEPQPEYAGTRRVAVENTSTNVRVTESMISGPVSKGPALDCRSRSGATRHDGRISFRHR